MEIVIMLVGMAVGAGIVGIVMSRGKASLVAKVEELSALLESMKSGAAELQARLDSETSARIKAETIATKLPDLEAAMATIRHEKESLLAGMAGLDAQMQAERKSAEEKQKLIEEAGQKLGESFKAMAADALQVNNKAFLQLASENLARFNEKAKQELSAREKSVENMVKPIGDTLAKVDAALRSVEKERVSAYSGLVAEVKGLAEANVQVRSETSKLVTALRRPQVRGAWGEMQLRRIAELAGMSEHCDFAEQVTTDNGNGAKNTRPDMVVSLPGGKH
ncbi:MAG: DNA recombination protein RmuC, partial [Nitrospinota bacterium]|nr:DNA recombination protein RmuC [Nitrospinota bacterium]